MDWSLILGILGIVVSILVGWLTYGLADRRARSNRHIAAKNTVLQELSKSLGEASVPTPDILEATIRSVLREVGDPKVQMDVDEVLDDLVRQVTSDPFLDSERRRKLQEDIRGVRAETSAKQLSTPREELDVVNLSHLQSTLLSSLAAITAAFGTFLLFASLVVERADMTAIKEFFATRQKWPLVAIAAGGIYLLLFLADLAPPSIKNVFTKQGKR